MATDYRRHEYHIEWWANGKDIGASLINTSNLKHFLDAFKEHRHLRLVFLKRCHDNKVLYDKRAIFPLV
jgi:cytidylate kinase